MANCKSLYETQEDSNLLEKYVRQYSKGKVLDIGTGSGIQAIAAAQNNNVKSVLSTDIQKGVIEYCKKNIKNKKIKFIQSDLFKKIKGKFDTIIFNPPYLPQELKFKDLTIEGGKKGYETIQKFINDVNEFLSKDGIILIVFSSLTKKEKIEEFIKNNLLDYDVLEREHIFFEDIYVYLLKKNELLRKLESQGIRKIIYFTKGHRGLLFRGTYKNVKSVIKAKNPQSTAIGRIENEAHWLKKLNKFNIGPSLQYSEDYYFICRYIDGYFIIDYIRKSNKKNIKKIIKEVLNQLFVLDGLNIDKEEMHHPLKHIIVGRNKPYLIDFERTHYSTKPKNVTQFCQFLMGNKLMQLMKNKGFYMDKDKIIDLAKIYKNSYSKKNFTALVSNFFKLK